MPHKKHHKKEHHKKPKSLIATVMTLGGLLGATGLRAAAKSERGKRYIEHGKQLAREYKEKLPQLKANLRVVSKGNANKYWKFYGENKAHFDRMHGERAMEELRKAYHAIKHTL